jgi:hypothetical protein
VTNITGLPPITDTVTSAQNPNLNNPSESFLVVPMMQKIRGPAIITATATLTPFEVGAPPVDVILTVNATACPRHEKHRDCHKRHRHSRCD